MYVCVCNVLINFLLCFFFLVYQYALFMLIISIEWRRYEWDMANILNKHKKCWLTSRLNTIEIIWSNIKKKYMTKYLKKYKYFSFTHFIMCFCSLTNNVVGVQLLSDNIMIMTIIRFDWLSPGLFRLGVYFLLKLDASLNCKRF